MSFFEPSSCSLRCFFIKLHIFRPSRRRSLQETQSSSRDATCQASSGPISTCKHVTFRTAGTATARISRLAKDPYAHRSKPDSCQLARRGLLFNLRKQDYSFRAQDPKQYQTSQVSPPRASLLKAGCGGKCRGCIVVHRVRQASDTRDAFVEARPGRKKISSKLITRPYPLTPGSILLACLLLSNPSCLSIQQASTSSRDIQVLFASRRIAAALLTDRHRTQVVVRGCYRIIALATRLAVLYKQIYSPLHGPRGRTPRVWKTTPYHPAARKAIQLHSPYLLSPSSPATSFQTCCKTSVSNHCHARCSSVSCTYPRIDAGGFLQATASPQLRPA